MLLLTLNGLTQDATSYLKAGHMLLIHNQSRKHKDLFGWQIPGAILVFVHPNTHFQNRH
jgi:hypothetical protein